MFDNCQLDEKSLFQAFNHYGNVLVFTDKWSRNDSNTKGIATSTKEYESDVDISLNQPVSFSSINNNS
jgi:hypothetical protein